MENEMISVRKDDLEYLIAHVADEMHGHPDRSHWQLPGVLEPVARLHEAALRGQGRRAGGDEEREATPSTVQRSREEILAAMETIRHVTRSVTGVDEEIRCMREGGAACERYRIAQETYQFLVMLHGEHSPEAVSYYDRQLGPGVSDRTDLQP